MILAAIGLVWVLRSCYPSFGSRVGGLISGLFSDRARSAFSALLDELPQNGAAALEVFYEKIAED